MAHTLEFYWDFSSPFAYFASTQADALASRTGATLIHRPMLLGGVFKALGQVDVPLLAWSEAKRQYFFKDLQRWADHWSIPYRFPTTFPMSSLKALRVYLALPEAQRAAYRKRVFEAYWAEGRDISSDDVLRELVGEGAEVALQRSQQADVKQALIDATKAAVDRGVFGAPTWVVNGTELFWGQDRLVLVEEALRT